MSTNKSLKDIFVLAVQVPASKVASFSLSKCIKIVILNWRGKKHVFHCFFLKYYNWIKGDVPCHFFLFIFLFLCLCNSLSLPYLVLPMMTPSGLSIGTILKIKRSLRTLATWELPGDDQIIQETQDDQDDHSDDNMHQLEIGWRPSSSKNWEIVIIGWHHSSPSWWWW